MTLIRNAIFGLSAAALVAGTAIAGGHGGNPAVKARKAHMQLYAYNLGILGGMAKGEVEFNADAAQVAADNLATLANMNIGSMWMPGTSSEDLPDESRALAAIWQADSMIMAEVGKLGDAANAMAAAAGTLEGVQGAIGAVGGSCGSCHKAYRAPSN